ncbi:23S rRNA (uracil(1939)-C(5))-methyltransferase RlmD [Liquorilactobacillus hordei]|uniref:23S rRNA (uracil(1939)-C(5))-methyltransferase RlmD n=1 Tax=Liquorilactobacillus hordei TaxID=468911 RepID=UPI001CBC4960|nr:23S rRNA (uracil(1939)-C(5))-methyltransferase RlmD [Liquorilactobacillus hordei]MBZ2406483.1 23S rRNA (uracil(1939)-C(5))-methyltransferase RlmD [Liquorilactobacillus hordei]
MSKPPVTKNQKLTLTISDLTYQGMGVGKVDHYPLFIEDALPDEVVDITVMKASKNYGFAKVINRHSDSPLRTAGINKTYTQTGIAPLQHLKYDAQLSFKRNQVVELLKKSHLEEIEVAPVLGMDEPVHYRNKAQVPVRMVKNQLETGFFKKNSHNFVPMEDYLIQDERIDEVIKSVRNILRKYMISAYDEKTHKGVVRHIIVRRGYYSHEVMVVLVTRAKKIPESDEIVDEILKACPDVRTVVQNVNQEKTNVILGKTEKILAGDGRITDSLNGINFEISAHSFYQVNSIQTEKIYQKVVEAAELTGKETVIDAYCGIGTISLNLAQKAAKVYGVEIVPEAIADAKKNATVNDINNATFEVGTASEWMSKWSEDGIKPDVVVFDPPRKGLEPEVINSTVKLSPEKIVYVSCNPATLVRDIQLFTEQGYQVVKPIQPVDQFPMTTHIESVTVLKRVAGK